MPANPLKTWANFALAKFPEALLQKFSHIDLIETTAIPTGQKISPMSVVVQPIRSARSLAGAGVPGVGDG